eukprot:TRINITY_DN33_c0_g2_i2.p1 TRINITY_DN33_c0_g2~~TRINITY_DN33_c0_g2_i2.p1  ORF type:complete len:572 (-),score=94.80 TRINITY_DN33_c0_g2_i2:600-2315(-)
MILNIQRKIAKCEELGRRNGQRLCYIEYEEEGVTYKGEVDAQNHRHGLGLMKFEREGNYYFGDFKNDETSGWCSCFFRDEDVSTEGWLDKDFNGRCCIEWRSPNTVYVRYEGEVRNSNFNGEGFLEEADGTTYRGQFVEGNKQGKGSFRLPNGDVYEGDVVENLMEGMGKLTSSDGTIYEGQFKQGEATGKGRVTYSNGAVFEGNFKNLSRTGKCVGMLPCGTLKAHYENDERIGKAEMIWRNGDVWRGKFLSHNLAEGTKYFVASGDTLRGKWKGYKLDNGLGEMTMTRRVKLSEDQVWMTVNNKEKDQSKSNKQNNKKQKQKHNSRDLRNNMTGKHNNHATMKGNHSHHNKIFRKTEEKGYLVNDVFIPTDSMPKDPSLAGNEPDQETQQPPDPTVRKKALSHCGKDHWLEGEPLPHSVSRQVQGAIGVYLRKKKLTVDEDALPEAGYYSEVFIDGVKIESKCHRKQKESHSFRIKYLNQQVPQRTITHGEIEYFIALPQNPKKNEEGCICLAKVHVFQIKGTRGEKELIGPTSKSEFVMLDDLIVQQKTVWTPYSRLPHHFLVVRSQN